MTSLMWHRITQPQLAGVSTPSNVQLVIDPALRLIVAKMSMATIVPDAVWSVPTMCVRFEVLSAAARAPTETPLPAGPPAENHPQSYRRRR